MVIPLFLFLYLLSGYLYLITGIGVLDDLLNLLLVFTLLVRFLFYKKYVVDLKFLIILFCFIFWIYISFLVNNFLLNLNLLNFSAVFYEMYKLLIIPLISVLIILNYQNLKSFLNIIESSIKILIVYVLINILIISIQYFKPDVLLNLGAKYSLIKNYLDSSRPTGLNQNINITAEIILLSFIISDYFLRLRGDYLYARILQILSIIGIILSSSKHSIFLLFVYLLLNMKKLGHKVLIVTFSGLVIVIFYFYNIYSLNDKISMYIKLFRDLGFLLESSDFFDLLANFELRAVTLLISLHYITKNFPFGLGLGTWGDASSKINKNISAIEYPIFMADNYVIHLFVEQGIFAILIFILYYKLIKDKKIFLIFVTSSMVSMTISGMIIPFLISLTIYTINTYEKLRIKE